MNLKKLLDKYGIDYLWHFTDISNLESIQKNNLLSLAKIKYQNIEVPCYGADALSHLLDIEYGLDQYVHLTFVPDHPMYHRKKSEGVIKEPIWLKIGIEVLFQENVYYSDTVANASNSIIFKADELESNLDLDMIMHPRDFQTKVNARKAEILVPDQIFIKDIKGFYHG